MVGVLITTIQIEQRDDMMATLAYKIVYHNLRKRITSGELARGAKLDGLRTIAKDEGVSVVTASSAVDLLAREGYLEKIDRKGVFVTKKDRTDRIQDVAILIPDVVGNSDDWGLHSVLPIVQQKLSIARKRISLHSILDPESQIYEFLSTEKIAAYKPDGLIIMGAYDFKYLSTLSNLRIPTVASTRTPLE